MGRFSVLEAIGQGGMGRVYAAYDPQLDRRVALKVLLDPSTSDGKPRLLREAHALAKLSHPNVVAVHEVGTSDGQWFVAMEYVDGITLRQWLRDHPIGERDIKQGLRLLVQAGRGLAAAHAANIVHRDFTPGNVLIGMDGRVRVVDFGLAGHTAATGSEASGTASTRADHVQGNKVLSEPSTFGGTPAYMAPEQWYGEMLDEKTDQFAFCSIAWEILFGVRPFEANTPTERLELIAKERPHRPEHVQRVSPNVERLLRRGLRDKPGRRHRSMESLLEQLASELSEGGSRRGAQRLVAVGAVASIVAVGGGYLLTRSSDAVCTGAEQHMASVWDDARRNTVRDAILGTKLSYAPAVWDRTRTMLDDYAGQWTDMHTDTCMATSVRLEQSEAVMDLRMACLQRARQHLQATVSVLADADVEVVAQAHKLTDGLSPLTRCADVEALQSAVPPPAPDDVAKVESLRGILAQLQAQSDAGRLDVAEASLLEAEQEFRAVNYPPVELELHLQAAALLERRGSYPESEARYRQALELATSTHDLDGMQQAASELLWVIGSRLQRFEEALQFRELAIRLAPKDSAAEIAARRALGYVRLDHGQYEEAQHEFEQAQAIQEQLRGKSDLAMATSFNDLGAVFREIERWTDAEHYFQKARAIWERELGSDHPSVALAWNNIGRALADQNRYDEAEQGYRRAFDIRQGTLNANHPHLASSHFSIGDILRSQGRFKAAETEFQKALEIWKIAIGPEHSNVAYAHNSLGICALAQGQYEKAEAAHRQALAIREKALGREHPRVADSYNNLGVVFYHAGRYDEAQQAYQQTLAIREKALGPEHADVGGVLGNLGEVYCAQERYADAEEANRHALAIYNKALRPDHPRFAEVQINFGVLFNAQRRYEEAQAALQTALNIIETEQGKDHPLAATALTLLAASYLGQGDIQLAVDAAERALSIAEKSDLQPKDLGDTRFTLAQALWAANLDRPRAVALAREAVNSYEASRSAQATPKLDDAATWLAKHDKKP